MTANLDLLMELEPPREKIVIQAILQEATWKEMEHTHLTME